MSSDAINLQKNPDFRNLNSSENKVGIWEKYKIALDKAGNDVLERIGYSNPSVENNVS